jgi:nicotinamide mononucleotide transporter
MPNFALSQLFTSPLEFAAFATSVVNVSLITIQSPKVMKLFGKKIISFDFNWNWPVGIVTSVLYFFVFWKYHLWMNSILQVFYVASGFWGWYQWLFGGPQKSDREIQRAKMWQMALSLAAIVGITAICVPFMYHFADAAPFWDSVLFGMSVVAQVVMTWKFREHWWIWVIEDVIATILFWNLGLGLTSILYAIFGMLCVRGMFTWNNMEKSEHKGRMSLVEVK